MRYEYREDIVEAYLSGMKAKDMMEKFNLSKEGVYMHLRKMEGFEKAKGRKLRSLYKQKKEGNKEIIKSIKAMLKSGMKRYEVRRALGIGQARFTRLLMGTRFYQPKGVKEERNKKIVDLYKAGVSQIELGRKFNVAQSRISVILKKYS